MNQFIADMKILYESAGSGQSIADAFGVSENDFKSVLKNVITNHPNFQTMPASRKMQIIVLALQNFKAINGTPSIKIEDIDKFANRSLNAFKRKLPDVLLSIFKDELGIELDARSRSSFGNINIEFNKSIIKLSKDSSLGDIVENFITVNDMKILYESATSQESFYRLDLDDIFKSIDTTNIDLNNVELDSRIFDRINNLYNNDQRSQADKMLEDAIGTDVVHRSPGFIQNPRASINTYLQSLIRDNLALAVVTAISHNSEVFNKNGIEIVTGITQNFIKQKKIFDFPEEDMQWADSIVRQFGSDPNTLNETFNAFIDDATMKYFMLDKSPDSLYNSEKASLDKFIEMQKARLESEKKTLLDDTKIDLEILESRVMANYSNAVKVASNDRQAALNRLATRKLKDSSAEEDEIIKVENAKKFLKNLGMTAGGVYSTWGLYNALIAAVGTKGVLASVTATASALTGGVVPLAMWIAGGYVAGKLAGSGMSMFKRTSLVRRLLKIKSPSNETIDLDRKQDEYDEEAERIEQAYQQALFNADAAKVDVINNFKGGQYRAALRRANEIDVEIKQIEFNNANVYDTVRGRLVSRPIYASVRRSIAAAVLGASKVAQKAITPESYRFGSLDLLLEGEIKTITSNDISIQLKQAGISDISNEILQVTSYVLDNLFDIKVDGVDNIDLDKVISMKTREGREEEVSKIPAGEPAIKEIEMPERVVDLKEEVEIENVLPAINMSGGDNSNNFLQELSTNKELQEIIERLISGEKFTYETLLSEIEGTSDSLDGLEKSLIEGMDAFKQSLPPVPMEFAKQVIKDALGKNKIKIKDIDTDVEENIKPKKLQYKKLYTEDDLKARISLLSKYFKISKGKDFAKDNIPYILPKLGYFITSILKDKSSSEKEDFKNLKAKYVESLAKKIVGLYVDSQKEELEESFNITRRNLSLIAERRLKMERDIHNVLYKAWKI